MRNRTTFVRGLFSGGTLAAEAVAALEYFLTPLASNVKTAGSMEFSESGHLILDLGADEFTVGRPHPMIDQELLLERIEEEAVRDETGLILLDLVLGDGAHSDPAARLAPAIRAAIESGGIEVGVLVVGTESDPQDLTSQMEQLKKAGAVVFRSTQELARYTAERYTSASPAIEFPVELADLVDPACINVGLEHFHDSLVAQEAPVVHVEWRPPAGGDAKLQAILARMG